MKKIYSKPAVEAIDIKPSQVLLTSQTDQVYPGPFGQVPGLNADDSTMA